MSTYLTIDQIAKTWQISARQIRNYCADGRIKGAKFKNGSWLIPKTAEKPRRKNYSEPTLLSILRREDDHKIPGGIYHKVQIELTYNSNHIEGSTLTHDQTRYIFETNTLAVEKQFPGVKVDDIIETANHFRCIDHIIENANRHLTENFIKNLHFMLKNGTSDSLENWFAVGDYKKLPNEVGGAPTAAPTEVKTKMQALLRWYNNLKNPNLTSLLEFHYRFEKIHPFQDGNGRIGRLILFKECLRCGIVPFIIDEKLKLFYYRGLANWPREKGYLKETCLAAQDKFKTYLDYFAIPYKTS